MYCVTELHNNSNIVNFIYLVCLKKILQKFIVLKLSIKFQN